MAFINFLATTLNFADICHNFVTFSLETCNRKTVNQTPAPSDFASPLQVRSMVSDYAVILTIIIFVLVDQYYALETPKLIVPTVFKVQELALCFA